MLSFGVLACHGEKVPSFHSFIAGRAESLFSINFCHCLTIGKSIHRDFGTNFSHLQAGNHLNFEHKIKTNWSTMTRRENHAVYLHSDVIAR